MAFTTGTAKTPAALLNALNTFLTANGWTRLRGDTDMNMASPKAARYWRMIATRSVATTTFGLNRLHLRTTVGGANVATVDGNWNVELTTGNAASLIAGGTNRATHSNSAWNTWILEYDFGSPTIVREVAMTGDATAANSPTHFAIQWSNDRVTWNNMETYNGLTWTNTELKTFTYADGFVSAQHPDSTSPYRSGRVEDQGVTTFTAAPGIGRECQNDFWSWQGPGYDASRRVFIHMRGHFQPGVTSANIEMWAGTGFDAAITNPNLQPGTDSAARVLMMNSSTVTYWFYANSFRVIIVAKSGINYTSAYVGFLGSFVQPEFYPFPLAVIATGNDWLTTFDTANNHHSSIVDPGAGMFSYRRWDSQWIFGRGRATGGASDNMGSSVTGLRAGVWPAYLLGAAFNSAWPGTGGGNHTQAGTGRLVDRLVPTLQNELPLLPAIMMDCEYGNIGVLADTFVAPSGGILVPEQTLTIGADTYRVFPNRDRRANADWFAIKEAA